MTERQATTTTPPLVRAVHVPTTPDAAFRVFTERITEWWPLQKFGLYQATTAGVTFEIDGSTGVVVERSTDGESGVWAEVLEWAPPSRLALSWHPGDDSGRATTVEVEFTGDGDGTRVVLTHHGWEAYGEQAEEARNEYENGWVGVLGGYVALAGAG